VDEIVVWPKKTFADEEAIETNQGLRIAQTTNNT